MTSERKFVAENLKRVLLKEFIQKRTERAGFGGLDIQRTPMGTRITMVAERPGMVIGRRGAVIKELTRFVDQKFDFDNPQIEVQDAPNTNLNPQIMAQKLAVALERGWHFRRAGHSTVRRIMHSGARGCQIILSGKLTGARHRTEKFKSGHIKFCGEPAQLWMKEGFAVAKKKLGTIGIKVQIMDPEARLPDEISVHARSEVPEDALELPPGMEPAEPLQIYVTDEDEDEDEITEIHVESVEEAEGEDETEDEPEDAPEPADDPDETDETDETDPDSARAPEEALDSAPSPEEALDDADEPEAAAASPEATDAEERTEEEAL